VQVGRIEQLCGGGGSVTWAARRKRVTHRHTASRIAGISGDYKNKTKGTKCTGLNRLARGRSAAGVPIGR
jgi:hypothetical protein